MDIPFVSDVASPFLEVGILGTALSFIIQWAKEKFGTEGTKTKLFTVLLAMVVGGAYSYLQSTVYWQAILGVLGSASSVYALLLKK